MSVLAVDLGGSHITCALTDDRRILSERNLPVTGRTVREIMPALLAALHACRAEAGCHVSPLQGIAVGYCGIVDGETNEVLSVLNKYVDAADFPWNDWAAREFGIPLRMENDARLALLGEVWAGAAHGAGDVVLVTLGTGIGGAAMLGGRLLHSRSGHAGALGGHITINLHGRPCVCGSVGCAEAEASTSVLPALCREHAQFDKSRLAGEARLDFETLFRVADLGDTVAVAVLERCLAVWSALTLSLVHAYGPELVLFGGGVMHRGDVILPAIRSYVAGHMWRTRTGVPRIENAQLGRHAALLGGDYLFAREHTHVHV